MFLQYLDAFPSISVICQSFINLPFVFLFHTMSTETTVNAQNVIITLVKKYTAFWGKANTVTVDRKSTRLNSSH